MLAQGNITQADFSYYSKEFVDTINQLTNRDLKGIERYDDSDELITLNYINDRIESLARAKIRQNRPLEYN